MNNNYAKLEFEIQLLYIYHESNGDSVYTNNIYKIYSLFNEIICISLHRDGMEVEPKAAPCSATNFHLLCQAGTVVK